MGSTLGFTSWMIVRSRVQIPARTRKINWLLFSSGDSKDKAAMDVDKCHHHHEAGLQKSGERKNLSLPMTSTGYGATFTYT